MAYTNTFIHIADDSPAAEAEVPPMRGAKKPIHLIHYELLTEEPYSYSHEDLIFETYLIRNDISAEERKERGTQIWNELFSKEHPCLRASALTKRYGWGAHYNAEGKIALVPAASDAYFRFATDAELKQLKAMRSRRKK